MTGFRPVRARLLGAVVLAALVPLAACGKSPFAPSQNTGLPFSYVDVTVGTGTEAVLYSTAIVDYAGYLYDPGKTNNQGLLFDTSLSRQPLAFVIGVGQMIPGFEQGVLGMKVGGFRRVTIPPELGYGALGSYPIPKNATLVFDISLLSVTLAQ